MMLALTLAQGMLGSLFAAKTGALLLPDGTSFFLLPDGASFLLIV